MKFHNFLEILELKTGKAMKTTSGYSTCCPAHKDRNPSLSIGEGSDGKILLHCFSGCSVSAICESLEIEVSDLFQESLYDRPEPKQTIYRYEDEQGKELYRKIRIEPGFAGKDKSFYSERTNENGVVIKNLQGCRRMLYRLPEVLQGIADQKTIFITEGEKDVDNLFSRSLIATTASESLKWSDEFTKTLEEADIVILYDLDKTGLERRDLLCKSLYGKVKKLRVVDLPGLEYQESHGSDVSDWFKMGHTVAELLTLVSNASDYSPIKEKGKIQSVSLGEFLDMKLPERELLLIPFLPSQGLAMVYAKRGVGKTHAALGIACAVAGGGQFWKWKAPKAKKVLFVDGEMPGIAIQERLRRITGTDEFDLITKNNFQLITPDLQDGPMPDLSTKAGRDSIEPFVANCDLIIIDNISSLFRSGVENEAESWQPAQDWALELRRRGKSILFIHHAGKGGQQRGSSKKEDILDAVICLKHPPNYRADQGAKFEVIFEKTRHFAGEQAMPFQVELCQDENSLWKWDIDQVQIDPEVIIVADLTKKGHTIKEIMEQTGLTKAKVEKRQHRARDLELMD